MISPRTRGWAWPTELHKYGILGINARNLSYIQEANKRKLFPRVDNKLITKQICQEHDIPIPQTYGVIHRHGDVHRFWEVVRDYSNYVVKPASGAAGRGIIVIAGRSPGGFLTPGGRQVTHSDMRYHISTVISGLYSLGGQADQAIIEQRVIIHPGFERIAIGGTPDIRVILYLGVPVMAMVRLPTSESGGRANLHQGAVAAAVDLVTGVTFGGVCRNRIVTHHPDTRELIAGFEIPGWKDLLAGAMKLGDALELGYLGVDFVVDAQIGPVVLEANARPGLAIQVAHGKGLRPVLEAIAAMPPHRRVGEQRWDLIRELAQRR